jgi:hypothetical protein
MVLVRRKGYRPTGYDWSRKSAYVRVVPRRQRNTKTQWMQRVRKFNGVQYYYWSKHEKLSTAKDEVKRIRATGGSARCVKNYGWWMVFARKSRRK